MTKKIDAEKTVEMTREALETMNENLKKSMEEYDKKMREMAMQEAQAQKSRIDVAPSTVLHQLDRMSGKKPGGKLIV